MNASNSKSLAMPPVLPGQVWTGRLTKYLGHMATVEDVAKDHITLRHHASNFRSKISLSTLISSYRLAEEADIATAARTVQVDGTGMLKTTATPRASPDKARQRDRNVELPPAETGTVVETPAVETPEADTVTVAAAPTSDQQPAARPKSTADVLAALRSARCRLAVVGDEVELVGPVPPELRPRVLALAPHLCRLHGGHWQKDLAAWPLWRREAFAEARGRWLATGETPEIAAQWAYVEIAELPEISALTSRDLASTRILEAIEAGEIRLDEAGAILHSRNGMSEEDGHAISRNAALVSDCASGRWEQLVSAWPGPLAQRWREVYATNVRSGQSARVSAWQAFIDLSGRWKEPPVKPASPDKVTGVHAAQPMPTVSDGDLSAVSVPFHDDKILVLWNGRRPWVPVFLVARRVGVGDASVVSRIVRRYPDTDVAKLRTALTNDKGFPRISVCVSPEVLHHWLSSVQFSADAATLSVYRAGARDAINAHLGDLFGYVAPTPPASLTNAPKEQAPSMNEPMDDGTTTEPVAPQTCAPDDSHNVDKVNAEVCDAPQRDTSAHGVTQETVLAEEAASLDGCATFTAEGIALAIPTTSEGEPKIYDLNLARALGYERPRKIRDLIRACETDGSIGPHVDWRTRSGRQSTGNGGTREYNDNAAWLTEAQALRVTTRSTTPRAHEITGLLIRVFMLARRGLLPGQGATMDAGRLDRLEQRLVSISEESRRTSELMLASVQAVQQLAAAVAQPRLAQPIDAATAAENARKAEILDQQKRNASDRGQDTKALSRIYPAIRNVYLPLLQQFIGQHLEVINLMDPKARARCVGAGQTKDMFIKWLKEKTSYDAPTEQVIYWMISDITDGVQIKRGKGVALPFALKLSAVPDPRQTTIPGVGGK